MRATQFFEFVGAIAESGTDGRRHSPVAGADTADRSDDVAAALADRAGAPPVNGMVEVAGPEPIALDKIGRQFLPQRATAAR